MGQHSYLVIAGRAFLTCQDDYLPQLAALFTEADRVPLVRSAESDDQGWEGEEFAYVTTVASLRERLQVQGFTTVRARADLAETLAQASRFSEDHPAWSWHGPVPEVPEVQDAARRLLAADGDDWTLHQPEQDLLHDRGLFMPSRTFVRLLLDCAPDQAAVRLELSELTGGYYALDPAQPVADGARAARVTRFADDAPLLVLTEGPTDARFLAAGMEVTHPHLKGFVTFFDYDSSGAAGGVDQLAKTVKAFIAAGVANRFVALADNDTEGHAGLAPLTKRALPERARVRHYPPLPFLEAYPTLGPYTDEPVLADINGRAGSLEMYLGQDVLQSDDGLMPVQWRNWNHQLSRYHGTFTKADKETAQDRFARKVEAHHTGRASGREDWSGIQAIIDTIMTAFD